MTDCPSVVTSPFHVSRTSVFEFFCVPDNVPHTILFPDPVCTLAVLDLTPTMILSIFLWVVTSFSSWMLLSDQVSQPYVITVSIQSVNDFLLSLIGTFLSRCPACRMHSIPLPFSFPFLVPDHCPLSSSARDRHICRPPRSSFRRQLIDEDSLPSYLWFSLVIFLSPFSSSLSLYVCMHCLSLSCPYDSLFLLSLSLYIYIYIYRSNSIFLP